MAVPPSDLISATTLSACSRVPGWLTATLATRSAQRLCDASAYSRAGAGHERYLSMQELIFSVSVLHRSTFQN